MIRRRGVSCQPASRYPRVSGDDPEPFYGLSEELIVNPA